MKKYLTERDFHILRFLWKWKLLSTLSLARKFFPQSLPAMAYQQLYRLNKLGYVSWRHLENTPGSLWVLSNKGYKAIESALPELRAEGFKSEYPDHDRICTAVHLGEWLVNRPQGADLFSEQQLRRYHPSLSPSWLPCDGLEGEEDSHRPDGFWKVSAMDKDLIVALEVELVLKTRNRYDKVAHYFAKNDQIDTVVWIIRKESQARTLSRHFYSKDPYRYKMHNFLLLRDIELKGWSAGFILGSYVGKTLSALLTPDVKHMVKQTGITCFTQDLLDTRKKPINTKSSNPPHKTANSN